MNKEELRKLIIDSVENTDVMTVMVNEFEKEVKQDFLREVLPAERKFVSNSDGDYTFGENNKVIYFNGCRQEIINKAKLKGIEI